MSANEFAAAPNEGARRVALLARPGPARDQLRQALEAAGAVIVLEEDPNSLQGPELQVAAPQVVLVALEPATEESLVRFESVLNDPAIAVIYDEAELAARREGWEAQRWARHLRAKLNGHDDVLPPGGEREADMPAPGRPTSPAQSHSGADMHLEEAQMHSFDLPSGGLQLETVEPVQYLDLEPEAWQPRPAPPEHDETAGFDAAPTAAVDPPAALDQNPPAAAAPRPAGSGRVLTLEAIEEPEEAPGTRGALLLFAGIGGPDAVRKVLAELPAAFPRPVLVRMRLDGGRYDNLVKQMSRVSVLPVALAVAGKQALPMRVYVLPANVNMQVVDGMINFGEGESDMATFVASLPPADCAILMLSGSDVEQVDAVNQLGARGAYVAGQLPQGCYDAVAPKALAALGGITGTPADLAASAVAHLGH